MFDFNTRRAYARKHSLPRPGESEISEIGTSQMEDQVRQPASRAARSCGRRSLPRTVYICGGHQTLLTRTLCEEGIQGLHSSIQLRKSLLCISALPEASLTSLCLFLFFRMRWEPRGSRGRASTCALISMASRIAKLDAYPCRRRRPPRRATETRCTMRASLRASRAMACLATVLSQ